MTIIVGVSGRSSCEAEAISSFHTISSGFCLLAPFAGGKLLSLSSYTSDMKLGAVLTLVAGLAGLGATLFFFSEDVIRFGVDRCSEKLSPPLDNTSSRRSVS